MYYLTVVEEDMTCDVFTGNEASSEVDTCFKTSDGVVYGIPDTDVNSFGVIPYRSERPGAREHQYVPITVYPNFDTKKDVNTDTMLIGVRFDGKIQIFARDENCAENDLSIRCNVLNHLHSENIKKDRN